MYKDENSERLLGNYWACVMQLARSYEEQGRKDEVPQLMQWARDNIYIGWENHYAAADYFSTLGQHDIAIDHIYEAAQFLIERVGIEPAATYDNIIALTGVLIQEPYSAYDRAEPLYYQAIALAPKTLGGLLRVGRRPTGQGRCSRSTGHPPAVQRAIRRAAGIGRGRAHPPPVRLSMTEAVTVVIPHYRRGRTLRLRGLGLCTQRLSRLRARR